MSKIFFGFILGFLFSDVITSQFPKMQQYKIPPGTFQNIISGRGISGIPISRFSYYLSEAEDERMIKHFRKY